MQHKLNAGCGAQRLEGHIGLDIRLDLGTDVICDLTVQLPFAACSIDRIYTKSFLEHVADLEFVLSEFHRILKPGGTLYVYVPHWSNPFYYSDYTHRRFFGLKTFDYFAPRGMHRYSPLPHYSSLKFITENVRLLFKSPFRPLRYLMKGMQYVINKRPTWQLFYEFHLSSLIPCYAIEFKLMIPE